MSAPRRSMLLVAVAVAHGLWAQQADTAAVDQGGLSLIAVPVVGSNPATGFLFGAAATAAYFMGDPANTGISTASASAIYTTKKQWLFSVRANTFLAGDQWNMLTDVRYFITSQPTYGLGTGPQSAKPVANGFLEYTDDPYSPIESEQMMEFNYFRFHNTLMRRYQDTRFFAGIGYHLDIHWRINDQLLKLDTVPQQITSHYAYQTSNGHSATNYDMSGVSFNLLFDSRDNTMNPYSGRAAYANYRLSPAFLGSDQPSGLLWLEYRDYLHLSKARPRHLIALWTYGWFLTNGEVPYMDLPAVGWDQFGRSARGYGQGRFRGEDLLYAELEYRVPLQRNKETWGAVAFLNATTASNGGGNIDLFQYINKGYGLGLRIMVNKKAHTNLTVDYAFGDYGAQGFYLGVNEVF